MLQFQHGDRVTAVTQNGAIRTPEVSSWENSLWARTAPPLQMPRPALPPPPQRQATSLSSQIKSNLQYLDWWGSSHLSASCLSDYTYFFCKNQASTVLAMVVFKISANSTVTATEHTDTRHPCSSPQPQEIQHSNIFFILSPRLQQVNFKSWAQFLHHR